MSIADVTGTPYRTSERVRVASYSEYRDAQRAVDYLADQNFAVDRVSIVGRDLRVVERVTGRRGWSTALAENAVAGALIGAAVGLIFGILGLAEPAGAGFWLTLWGLVFGGVLGAVYGLGAKLLGTGARDFTSVQAVVAGRYDVVVDPSVASRAQTLLAQVGDAPPVR